MPYSILRLLKTGILEQVSVLKFRERVKMGRSVGVFHTWVLWLNLWWQGFKGENKLWRHIAHTKEYYRVGELSVRWKPFYLAPRRGLIRRLAKLNASPLRGGLQPSCALPRLSNRQVLVSCLENHIKIPHRGIFIWRPGEDSWNTFNLLVYNSIYLFICRWCYPGCYIAQKSPVLSLWSFNW